MAVIIRPPTTIQRPNTYGAKHLYTLHSEPNMIYAMKTPNPSLLVAVVGFSKEEYAKTMGLMLETHRNRNHSWPSIYSDESVFLPASTKSELELLTIFKWDEDDLSDFCAGNFFDLVTIQTMKPSDSGYSFTGNTHHYEVSQEFYRQRFQDLFEN